MTHPKTISHHEQETYSKTVFGFWIYLLTDFMMFAVFFATYAVLHNNTFGGSSAKDIFNLNFNLIQTITLLLASFTSGLGGVFAHRRDKEKSLTLFGITFFLGIIFLGMEFSEFSRLISEGNSWQKSGFLSAYFTLVGTHAIHMIFALVWIIVLGIPVWLHGLDVTSVRRLTCLRMFWQFLNIVWIFIFTIVYLMGAH